MIVVKRIPDLQKVLEKTTQKGQLIGFVPTMGALHQGHISLINNSKNAQDCVVSSIFVNPTQFNDPADFAQYPITIEKDLDKLEQSGCDIVFLPAVKEVYPNGLAHPTHYPLGYIETILEGKYRPGHFQGVCQVVHRLLNIVQPHQLYLGQKDYQQCMVIQQLIALTGLITRVIICPTLREPDGLAMSSRNMRLTPAERQQAVKLSETLQFIKNNIRKGYIADLTERAAQYLTAEGFKVDYITIADAGTLEPLDIWDGNRKIVVVAAAYLNSVRLIDNMLLQ